MLTQKDMKDPMFQFELELRFHNCIFDKKGKKDEFFDKLKEILNPEIENKSDFLTALLEVIYETGYQRGFEDGETSVECSIW